MKEKSDDGKKKDGVGEDESKGQMMKKEVRNTGLGEVGGKRKRRKKTSSFQDG